MFACVQQAKQAEHNVGDVRVYKVNSTGANTAVGVLLKIHLEINVTKCYAKYKKYIKNRQFLTTKYLYINTRTLKSNINIKENKHMARVLISMPERFLDEIDTVAGNENRSRSELIREALRTYIHRNKIRENTVATKNAAILDALLD